jgi:serine/threonine protein phosphatase 1
MAELTYAVGDIHGCHDLLIGMLGSIEDHAAGREHVVVFLGDYIDRGPDSAAVVNTVRAFQRRAPEHVICLKGNHEDMLLRAAANLAATPHWLDNGGDACLWSFGVNSPRSLPRDVVEWIESLPTTFEDERRYFVHAGFVPRREISRQRDLDMLWIREPFLSADFDFGKHVVHGHTPVLRERPEVLAHRTNLDTGAVFGGPLTTGVFTKEQDRAVAFLQAFRSGEDPAQATFGT